jgi:hypothetical protein
MPTLTRVEFSTSPSLRSSRVVLLIEFPDEALERIKKEKASLAAEACHIAWQAIGGLKLGILRGNINLISSTQLRHRRPVSRLAHQKAMSGLLSDFQGASLLKKNFRLL